jgi:hypothetical protein
MSAKFVVALAGAVLVAGLSSTFSYSQQFSNVTDVSVASGDYKPLTLWDSISLGASYYTNPERAKATSMAYSFDGPEFSDQTKSKALWHLAEQGKVSFGIADKDKKIISVVPLFELQKQYPVNGPADLVEVLTKPNIFVVGTDKILLGEASKAPVIKTVLHSNTK